MSIDKGPWWVGVTSDGKSRCFIQSEDFNHDVRLYVDGDFDCLEDKLEYAEQIAQQLNSTRTLTVVGWLYEDELPNSYPYNEMFTHSRVDGVRVFPVFAPEGEENV